MQYHCYGTIVLHLDRHTTTVLCNIIVICLCITERHGSTCVTRTASGCARNKPATSRGRCTPWCTLGYTMRGYTIVHPMNDTWLCTLTVGIFIVLHESLLHNYNIALLGIILSIFVLSVHIVLLRFIVPQNISFNDTMTAIHIIFEVIEYVKTYMNRH